MNVCDECRDNPSILARYLELSEFHCHCKCIYVLQKEEITGAEKWPAVAYAAHYGHDTCLQAIIDAGADVNVRSKKSFTSLMWAAQSGHDKCLDILLRSGADANITNKSHETALHFACECGDKGILSHVKCIEALIEAGADVNCASNIGVTPLITAAECSLSDNCVELLLKAGAEADPSFLPDVKYPPLTLLILAASEGNDQNVKLLLEAGASLNRVSHQGLSPLLSAINESGFTCVKLLLDAGADVNYIPNGDDALTPLSWATWEDLTRVLKLLLYSGADVNIIGRKGRTALYYANETVDCVRILLKSGARVNTLPCNALQCQILTKRNKDVHILLFAAGEKIDGIIIAGKNVWGDDQIAPVPDYLLFEDLKLDLKHLCREATRKHVLDLDPHTNLFLRVTDLSLPSLLVEYLLYDMSLNCDSDHDIIDDGEKE